MENLSDMAVFARVVERQSLTAAGKELRMSTSAVSKHLSRLEASLSLKLLERSAHGLRATDAGQVFYEHSVRILASLEIAKAEAVGLNDEVKGTLRVRCTQGIALNFVAPATVAFAKCHSAIKVELTVGDFPADLSNRAYDIIVASRHFDRGDPKAYDMLLSRNIGVMPYVICASPEYLRRQGVPRNPRKLATKSCLIHLTHKRNPDQWFFVDKRGKYSVFVNGAFRSNSESAILMAAVDGIGIARLPEDMARNEIAAGRLQSLFAGSVVSGRSIKALYPRTRYTPGKIKAFVDFLCRRYKTDK